MWVRFNLPAVTQPQRVLLNTSPWERVDFYFVRDGHVFSSQTTGTLVSAAQRSTRISLTPWFSHSGFAEVELLPQSPLTVFAHLSTTQTYRPVQWLRFYMWDAEQVRAGERRDAIVQGIFLGIVLFLAIYNLGLFFATRQASYLYYVLLQVAGGLFWVGLYGISAEYLWPGHPLLEYFGPWVAFGLSGFAVWQFLRHYLDSPRFFPRADIIMKWLAFSAAIFWIFPLIVLASPQLAVFQPAVMAGWIFVMSVGMIGVIILAYRNHHPLTRTLVAVAFCGIVGSLLGAAAALEVWSPNDLTIESPQIAGVIVGIIFSLGLGFRLRNVQSELAEKQLAEARTLSAHEREKRELIEEQSRQLETKVRERTAELSVAQEKSDALLGSILPQAIIEELKTKGVTEPRRYDEASILFADFAGFTETVASIPPNRLVEELDELFRGFDDLIMEHGLEKIKTIGDAYMAAAGLPVPVMDHATRCVRAALALTEFIKIRNNNSALKWRLRTGVHTGAVVAGIVGKKKYAYDVWGDTVNIASRIQSASSPDRVNVSAYTYEQVRQRFDCEYRGKLSAKGKGEIDMYYVLREFGCRDEKKFVSIS